MRSLRCHTVDLFLSLSLSLRSIILFYEVDELKIPLSSSLDRSRRNTHVYMSRCACIYVGMYTCVCVCARTLDKDNQKRLARRFVKKEGDVRMTKRLDAFPFCFFLVLSTVVFHSSSFFLSMIGRK